MNPAEQIRGATGTELIALVRTVMDTELDVLTEFARRLDGLPQASDVLVARLTALEARLATLTAALEQIVMGSLLEIRRAAFGPEIGVRYTEAIRSDIEAQCRRLEVLGRAALHEGEK